MLVTEDEVILGQCRIRVGPAGAEWDLGLTSGKGVRFAVRKELEEIPADQSYGFSKQMLCGVRQSIEFELEQVSPRVLQLVYDTEGSPPGETSFAFAYGPTPRTHRLEISGPARGGGTFVYVTNVHFISVGPVVRSEKNVVKLPVMALEVPTLQGDKATYGTYEEQP